MNRGEESSMKLKLNPGFWLVAFDQSSEPFNNAALAEICECSTHDHKGEARDVDAISKTPIAKYEGVKVALPPELVAHRAVQTNKFFVHDLEIWAFVYPDDE
jgi:hypothetical protein